MLKKISNSLSTDNSIPIFGYSINEADITSASFFLCRYLTLQGCVLSPLISIPLTPFSRGHIRAYGLSIAARLPCPPTPARHLKMPSLSRAGSCRSSEQHQSTKKAVAALYIAVAALYNERDRPERDGLILCFGSQETAMLCNQLFLGSLSSFSLLVPYVCIIHNRSTDEDGCVSTEADTEYQGYGKTTDRLAAEDCDSKHCHESRY